MKRLNEFLTPARRRKLYRIAYIVAPILVFYGLIGQQEAALWVGFLGAVLGATGNKVAEGHVYPVPEDENAPGE